MERPLVSIIIPAYNKPDYTRKTLQSIVEQDYRPIEVILSDDCSPVSLRPLVEEFRPLEDDLFSIRFWRQSSNLGPMDNAIFCYDQAKGKYLALNSHDDWYVDNRFIIEAVEIMENNPQCYLCGANSEYENEPHIQMIKLPNWLEPKDQWHILEGDRYIRILGYGGKDCIGHQAGSALVLNLTVLRSLGGYHYPYNITRTLAEKLDILPDEGFALQFLLSDIGSSAITEKIVSVRGRPKDSYSQSGAWNRVVGQAMFIIYYNLYKARLTGKYSTAVKKRAKETIFHYPVEKINFKILKHYHYAPDAIWLMSLSYIKYLLRVPRYYVSLIRRLLKAIRDRELSSLIAKHKLRGIVTKFLPFR